MAPAKSKLPCKFFNQPQGCRYGAKCKFLHATSTKHQTAKHSKDKSQTSNSGQNSTLQDLFNNWRYNIPTDESHKTPLGPYLTTFFQDAERLANGETGMVQDTIVKLASNGGLYRIKELVECDYDALTAISGLKKVREQLLPFFRILDHSTVSSSIILETRLGTIFNVIYGPQGGRAVSLFSFLVTLISSTTKNEESLKLHDVETILSVLSKVIDMNSDAMVNEKLKTIAETLPVVLKQYENDDILVANRLLDRISRRLGLGSVLLEPKLTKVDNFVKASFEIQRDQPGQLSLAGPRHDNDHADICDIRILPTYNEIMSSRPEYLPPYEPSLWHSPGLQGLLDRNFRLLREDTVGQLRDAIRNETAGHHVKATVKQSGSRVFTYQIIRFQDISFSRWKGLEFVIEVEQPAHLHGMPKNRRTEWWDHCKRLQSDALVCIVDQWKNVIFCVVSDDHDESPGQSNKQNSSQKHQRLPRDLETCLIRLALVDKSYRNIKQVSRALGQVQTGGKLIEFPGVLLPSFQPTLEALQKMSRSQDLPFAEIIGPHNQSSSSIIIKPSAYTTKPGFLFHLDEIMDNNEKFQFSTQQSCNRKQFYDNTSLDTAQANALLDCLQRSISLVQGPPGTGKSYTGVALIKVLLEARSRAKLGPILCVCYTNHALDQLLEQLLIHGIKQIIRMGSRSKSEMLENCNLRKVAYDIELTKTEKYERYQARQDLDTEEAEIDSILKDLKNINQPSSLKLHLMDHHHDHHRQLYGSKDEEEGWEVVTGKGSPVNDWLYMKRVIHPISDQQREISTLLHTNLFTMNRQERQFLHGQWKKEMLKKIVGKLSTSTKEHDGHKRNFNLIRNEQDLRCLQEANIIGVTTSGLARQLDLLRKLNSKVLICEEAGEVLEAHLLTALLPSLEHVILIGDHLQLPPTVQNYDLSRQNPHGQQYCLDISLFERLLQTNNAGRQGLPLSKLQIQRRMHPSISNLIRTTLYPSLEDAPSVNSYPEIAGMKKRLFWFDHAEPEAGTGTGQSASVSHSNIYEVNMVVALVTHLVKQGIYKANDIAVLTPYLGQLLAIRKILRTSFAITMTEGDTETIEKEGLAEENNTHPSGVDTSVAKTSLLQALKVATIDSFQGNEAKVVIISLVRSNEANKCGFLRTSNRINVLLSRAQHGMFIIGNSRTSGHVQMWSSVLDMLKEGNNFGDKLELQCSRHPSTSIEVTQPDDFLVFSPEGGCNLLCDKRLQCGHPCINKCHSDVLHSAVKCLEDCPRPLKGCDHACQKRCGEPCAENCPVIMGDVDLVLECGHVKQNMKCWEIQNPTKVKCMTSVSREIPYCGHHVEMKCYVDITASNFRCTATCNTILPCGHACQQRCYSCKPREADGIVKEQHPDCTTICDRPYNTCSHTCGQKCHGSEACAPCNRPCEVFCGHSKCSKKCHEPCAPCADIMCRSHCPHSKCTMPCAAPCNWVPCSKRCGKNLECGHQCPSICGEICPSAKYCQICAHPDVRELTVDFIMMSKFSEVDLDEDPCIIPLCGHLYTVSSMDGHMEMSKYFEEVNGGLKPIAVSTPFSMDELKSCATCRGSLRNIARYGHIVRRAMIDESTKRFIRWSREQTITLTEHLHDFEKQLTAQSSDGSQDRGGEIGEKLIIGGTPSSQIEKIIKYHRKYRKLSNLRNKILQQYKRVTIEEQPLKKVWDLVQAAKRNRVDVGEFDLDPAVLQTSEGIRVKALMIRCELVILSDFIATTKNIDLRMELSKNRQYCQQLVAEAELAHQPMCMVEGHTFIAQLCAAERSHTSLENINSLVEEGKTHITAARQICVDFPGSTKQALIDLEHAEKMLNEATFYTKVHDDEWIAVMAAMKQEFRGGGHWYTCANGHPFTIGECGMPMELAKCPQCGANIGGISHRPTEGVRHANELEERFGNMAIE